MQPLSHNRRTTMDRIKPFGHQLLYFDKNEFPFTPDPSQVIFFNVEEDASSHIFTNYLKSHYDEVSHHLGSPWYKFCFLPYLVNMAATSEVFSYFNPGATEKERDSFLKRQAIRLRDIDDGGSMPRLIHCIANVQPSERRKISMGLIAYVGMSADRRDEYAFFYRPLPEYIVNYHKASVDLRILEGFYHSYCSELRTLQNEADSPRSSINYDIAPMPVGESMAERYMLDDYDEGQSDDTLFDVSKDSQVDYHPTKRRTGASRPKKEAESPEADNAKKRWLFGKRGRSVFHLSRRWEPEAELGFSTEVETMLTDAQRIIIELRKRGVGQWVLEDLVRQERQLSRLHISGTRIFLTDYNNMEITMGPLPKAVFLLFLRHPEGIRFACLTDYRQELYGIYALLTSETDTKKIKQSVADVTDPTRNTINENASRIRRAFVEKIDPELAKHYFITGERGEAKRITLSPELVSYDTFLFDNE